MIKWSVSLFIVWLIDWEAAKSIKIKNWLTDDWLIDWWMIDWLMDDWLIEWWLIDDWWMIDWLIDWWLMIDDWWLIWFKVVKIQKQLASMFPGAEMSLNISPDECIAIGAAVQVPFTVHCTPYTVHCTLYTVHYTETISLAETRLGRFLF